MHPLLISCQKFREFHLPRLDLNCPQIVVRGNFPQRVLGTISNCTKLVGCWVMIWYFNFTLALYLKTKKLKDFKDKTYMTNKEKGTKNKE